MRANVPPPAPACTINEVGAVAPPGAPPAPPINAEAGLVAPPEAPPAPPINAEAGPVAALAMPENILSVAADDDAAPRLAAKGINKALKASPDSIIVGEKYHEVVELPDVVCTDASRVGAHNVMVLIDQNMEYPEGSIYGTELIAQMRQKGFVGLAAIRSANDSPKDEELYLDAGADGVVSKGLKKAGIAAHNDAIDTRIDLLHVLQMLLIR